MSIWLRTSGIMGPVEQQRLGGRMLGWIEKVVPHPPEASPVQVVVEKEPEKPSADTRSWLARQLPEPQPGRLAEVPGKKQEDSNESQDSGSTPKSPGRAVVAWISQGLGRVIPQPAVQDAHPSLQAVAKSFEASMDIQDVTEVQDLNDGDEFGFEVTDLDNEDNEGNNLLSDSDQHPLGQIGGKKVLTWLAQGFEKIMPHPGYTGYVEEGDSDSEAEMAEEPGAPLPGKDPCPSASPCSAGAKHRTSTASQSSLSVSLFPRSLGGDGVSVFEWLSQELEKVMPHPVSKTDENGQISGAAELGQARSKGA
nr:cyclic nucleotide-gated cation channel beta-1-like isoform X1 [Anolis sagrei ordinatus]